MGLVKGWGATSYAEAKRAAIRHNRYRSVKLLTEWEEAENEK